MGALEDYLTDVRDIKLSGEGVSELSYYPALRQLLEEVGGGLKPKVRCFMNLKDHGAGLPDGGLFTADQVRRGTLGGQKPARGAIEVKPPSHDAATVADSEQVLGYLDAYRQVLVTTLREFLLLDFDERGRPAALEHYVLAPTEAEFWALTNHPRRTEREHGDRFLEFLKRVLLSRATLASPQDLAWFLASYAREARLLVESAELAALDAVRKSLEEALGIKFEGAKGEHFFRSTLVQTLFYGLFASWVLWTHEHESDDSGRFEWRQAAWTLRVPVIQALFTQIATPHLLGEIGIVPLLDLAEGALNRVDTEAFFSRFEQHHAVQYFYEPFLEAFDPELRKELGVWYTPPEIVEYMVARVDAVLREDLDVADGLADPRVYVVDPCCGTGAYLVEVLGRIAQKLDEKGADALAAGEVKKAAMERVFGFEILPAPFVIAHMQLGLLLQNMHLPLEENERVGVFLTNALTGWDAQHAHQQLSVLPELEQERDAAQKVKQELPILVILGNPPYNGFAGTSTEEEGGLVEPYKEGLAADWGITKNYLDDLYVRFFRLAERRIAEMTGRGIVCYISNHSYLSDSSYVVMRRRLVAAFDDIWIESMHGDRRISEYAPDGRTSETIFAIPGFSPGIQQGIAISLWAKSGANAGPAHVWFRDDLTAAKAPERRAQLLASLDDADALAHYREALPSPENRYSFAPIDTYPEYPRWPRVHELAAGEPMLGLNDNRMQSLQSMYRSEIVSRMQAYYDPSIPLNQLTALHPGLTKPAAMFDPAATRDRLLRESHFDDRNVVRFWFKPFDLRWAYIERTSNLWNRVRPELLAQALTDNEFLVVRNRIPGKDSGATLFYSRHIADQHVLQTDGYFIPIWLHAAADAASAQTGLFDDERTLDADQVANLSVEAHRYLACIGADGSSSHSSDVWMHVLAVGCSREYVSENADGLSRDWPRIPLPNSVELLLASAELGRKVADLLDPETEVDGVTGGHVRRELKVIGVPMRIDGLPLNEKAGDLVVTAGWGHAGKGGVTMPGKGKTNTRLWTNDELTAIEQGAEALGLSPDEALAQLGDQAVDVYLNDVAYWRGVPAGVWSYSIGGYQVVKKWLSYREKALLGRDLRTEEVREVTYMVRRIAAILLLQPALDANYRAVKEGTYAWKPA
ncbi:MAG: N-6 DNA methylase [Armatimonadetes bacterium]|nr:N-6 DNA methylase [Armatimonadota bacterium]